MENENLSNDYPRKLSAALKKTIVNNADNVHSIIGFSDYLEHLQTLPNYTRKANWLEKASQQLFANYIDDAKHIWNAFDEESYNVWETLFDRRLLVRRGKFDVYLNYNAYDFYRDTNLSISLVHPETWIEAAILWFFILPDKSIEIFQLQWKRKYGIWEREFKLLIDESREFLEKLWFKKIFIVRSEKLYLKRVPTHLPSHIQNEEDYNSWLKKHALRMTLTYDVNPVRKWWFKIPPETHVMDYSWIMNLH